VYTNVDDNNKSNKRRLVCTITGKSLLDENISVDDLGLIESPSIGNLD
jgi:hypothetical protein